MCTATWMRTRGGYEVYFNRDELKTRKPARSPSVREREGVQFLAPEDADAGGTWIGVNEHGIAVGLANGPWSADAEAAREFRSRGLLVLDLLTSRDLGEVHARLGSMEREIYRSFWLFAIDRRGSARVWGFDGRRLAGRTDGKEGALLFSSSRDAEHARLERQSLLDLMVRANGGLDAKLLLAFHASHAPERGAFSPCMHREDASTVSFTRIQVGGGSDAVLDYYPGPPCEGAKPVTRRIPLRPLT